MSHIARNNGVEVLLVGHWIGRVCGLETKSLNSDILYIAWVVHGWMFHNSQRCMTVGVHVHSFFTNIGNRTAEILSDAKIIDVDNSQ